MFAKQWKCWFGNRNVIKDIFVLMRFEYDAKFSPSQQERTVVKHLTANLDLISNTLGCSEAGGRFILSTQSFKFRPAAWECYDTVTVTLCWSRVSAAQVSTLLQADSHKLSLWVHKHQIRDANVFGAKQQLQQALGLSLFLEQFYWRVLTWIDVWTCPLNLSVTLCCALSHPPLWEPSSQPRLWGTF